MHFENLDQLRTLIPYIPWALTLLFLLLWGDLRRRHRKAKATLTRIRAERDRLRARHELVKVTT
jgi:hypothetical protein